MCARPPPLWFQDKTNCCLMLECLPSKLPNFDWNTKWAHWPPKDSGPQRPFRIQTLTSSWQDSLFTGLRLYYEAADNSMAAAKFSHRHQQPSFFFPPPFFFYLLTSHNPCSPRFSSIMFRGSGWVPWRSEKALSWLQPSVGVITAWTNVIQQSSPHVSDKNNTGDITPLCPSIKSLLPNRGYNCLAVTHTTPWTQPAMSNNFLCVILILHQRACDTLMQARP